MGYFEDTAVVNPCDPDRFANKATCCYCAGHQRTCGRRSQQEKMAMLHRMRSAWAPSTMLAARAFSSAPAAAEIPDSWRNPAAVLHGIDDIRFEDVPLPDKVADGHVRVQMRAVGICGSDVHYYKKASHIRQFHVNTVL